ncbi:hypothetical protein FKP32DRAFT_1598149 [Trametes sanguinea]|nr:hypothetical protein FKP32DRAFT_1598149 [Trametes sanguinea]
MPGLRMPRPVDPTFRNFMFVHWQPRRERGRSRRTHAADVDARGRRGLVRHPEDGEELPEYDDKDVLPRYQDVEAGLVPGSTARPAPGPGPVPGAAMGHGAPPEARDVERREDPGQMVGVGTLMMGRSPNGDGGTSDTDPLVTRSGTGSENGNRTEMGTTSEDREHCDHAYPPPMSSAGSHEGYGDPRRHD